MLYKTSIIKVEKCMLLHYIAHFKLKHLKSIGNLFLFSLLVLK